MKNNNNNILSVKDNDDRKQMKLQNHCFKIKIRYL